MEVRTKRYEQLADENQALRQRIAALEARLAAPAVQPSLAGRLGISEQELERTLQAAQVHAWSWDMQQSTLQWSAPDNTHQALHDDFDSIYTQFLTQLHPDDRPLLTAALTAAHTDQAPFVCTYRMLLPADQIVWVNLHGQMIAADDGTPLRMVGVAIDITAQKQAELELQESHRRFTQLLEALPVGIFVLDAQGQPWYANQTAHRLLGQGITNSTAEQLPEIYHAYLAGTDQLYPAERQPVVQALAGQQTSISDMEIRRPNGRIRIEVTGAPLLDTNGAVAYAIAVFTDITARVHTEAALQQQTALVTLLQQVAVTANIALTVEDAMRDCLRHICSFTGWPVGHVWLAADTAARTLVPTNLWYTDDPIRYSALYSATMALQISAGEGLPGHVLDTGRATWITDASENPHALRREALATCGLHASFAFPVWVGDTIAAVLEFFASTILPLNPDLLEAMEHIGTQLSHTIARQRAEAALQEAKAEAEQASRAKSEFLSRMSHELRTPLNAILGFGQLLTLDVQSADQQESVGYITRAGQHLLRLINEVLDLAQIEAGRLTLSIEPVQICELLEEAISMIQPLADQRNIQIQAAHALADQRYVLADRQRLLQICVNLLANAVKYNRVAGQVMVICSESGATQLKIAVQDTGPGLGPAEQRRLFQPFERLSAAQSDVEGTGLGLALCRRLIDAMGGTIGMSSTLGQGSSFWVELPLVGGPEEQLDSKQPPPQILASTSSIRHTILYIEDNLSNLRLIERILTHRPSITMQAVMQGRLGLDLAREHRPDLILLDLNLPDMNGDSVLQELQDDPRTQAIPVVVISADATPRQIERLQRMGARTYLTKPLDITQFLTIVDELVLEKGDR